MLRITVPPAEMWDEKRQMFVSTKGQSLSLEHSLVSISKWEAKWHQAFLDERKEKTEEMMIDYIRCMTLTQNVDPDVYSCLTQENMKEINDYILDSHTATFFSEQERKGGGSREVVTSDLIYYWMVAFQIPFECQKWHLNRLLTLIRICNIKNEKPKKMSQRQIAQRNSALNAARRKKFGTTG